MSSHHRRTLGAIELGTSAVKVVIAEDGSGSLRPLSLGTCSTQGVRKGQTIDRQATRDCIQAAIAATERKAGIHIDRVHLAQSGAHIDSISREAAVAIESSDSRVRRDDIAAVCELARAVELPPERSVVHYFRRSFLLDGKPVPDPETLSGQKLAVGYRIVHGDKQEIRDGIRLLNGLNIAVDELCIAGVASGAIVTSPDEQRDGVLVLDLGAGTTDYALYREGRTYETGVVPIGGDHLTNDLQLGLRVTREQAEELKCRSARCVVGSDTNDTPDYLNSDLAQGGHPVPQQAIEQIVTARLRKVFAVVSARLGPMLDPAATAAGVVLTGGTAKLPGITELASATLGLPSRIGAPALSDADALNDPRYSTVLGLFAYARF